MAVACAPAGVTGQKTGPDWRVARVGQAGRPVRVFAISDIHLDYEENRRWLHNLSRVDYRADILILAGDISDVVLLLMEGFEALQRRFAHVLYVPGNHDLWVHRNGGGDSLAHFELVQQIAADYGIQTDPLQLDSLSIVPLLGWYDFSFGTPSPEIRSAWVDFVACKWPNGFDEAQITGYFISMNEPYLGVKNNTLISFSHFLPRIDLMPATIPASKRILYPVLGSRQLEKQIRRLNSDIHVYGHSHVNRDVTKDATRYINNALGYPHETHTRKALLSIWPESFE